MKTLTIGRYRLLSTVSPLTVMLIILFLTMNQIAFGAGAPSRSSTTSESAAEKREKASLNNTAYAFNAIYQANRLEQDKSTSNTAITCRWLDERDDDK